MKDTQKRKDLHDRAFRLKCGIREQTILIIICLVVIPIALFSTKVRMEADRNVDLRSIKVTITTQSYGKMITDNEPLSKADSNTRFFNAVDSQGNSYNIVYYDSIHPYTYYGYTFKVGETIDAYWNAYENDTPPHQLYASENSALTQEKHTAEFPGWIMAVTIAILLMAIVSVTRKTKERNKILEELGPER